MNAVALELDGALGDTRALWRRWLADAARRYRTIAALDPDSLPDDRGLAAERLDAWASAGIGDWRAALGRFAEEHAPVHLRPDAQTTAVLRRLQARGVRLGAFTDAPRPLADAALAQLGLTRRFELVEAGTGALDRLLERLGRDAIVVRSRAELARLAD